MSLADAVLTALKGFSDEVATWTNQGSLVSIQTHIAQIESAAAEDFHAGETAAKAVLGDLYAAFHGHAPATAEPAPTTAETSTIAGAAQPGATVVLGNTSAETSAAAPVDPTPAPSTTEASSAPSSTSSASTEPPAAPVAQ